MPFLVAVGEFLSTILTFCGLDRVCLALGVEDTVGLKQKRTKGKTNEENNSGVMF